MKLKPEYDKLSPENRLNKMTVPVIGLTGGIASGKSTVSRLLRERGLVVLDADQMVKDIYAESSTFAFIKNLVPESIEGSKINFSKLRGRFFSDEKIKNDVEAFIYQRLPEMFKEHFEKSGKPEYVIYDVPLLFEKKLDSKVDLKVLVYAPRKIQLARLMTRDGHLEEMAETILKQQMDIEGKKSKVDVVIDNSQTEAELVAEVELFISKYFSE
jgi:dephospho-CoA kinase